MPGTVYTINLKVTGQEQVRAATVDLSRLSKAEQDLLGSMGQRGLERLFASGANSDMLRRAMVPGAGGPTPIPGGAARSGVDWKQFLLGVSAAPFSPWVSARALSGSGAFGRGGGGGGGGLLGALMGAGGLGGFMEAYIAVQVAMRGLRMAFEELTHAIQRGTQLYLKSAEIGAPTETTARLQKTAQLLGMSENALTQLVASGQFMRGSRMTSGQFAGAIMGSGRGVGGKEDMQAVRNLAIEAAEAWQRVSSDALESAQVAHQLFRINMDFAELKSAWQTLWEQGTALVSVGVQMTGFIQDFTLALRGLSAEFLALNFILQKVGLEAKGGGEGFQQFQQARRLPTSAWEKMGLVVGDSKQTDYAKQTAQNTARIAALLAKERGAIELPATDVEFQNMA